MARLENWVCMECQTTQYSSVPKNRVCSKCKAKGNEQKEREYFQHIDSLTIEERLREIEKWIYNHSHEDLQPKDIYY